VTVEELGQGLSLDRSVERVEYQGEEAGELFDGKVDFPCSRGDADGALQGGQGQACVVQTVVLLRIKDDVIEVGIGYVSA